MIAPINPANIIGTVTKLGSINPLPIVVATAVVKKKAAPNSNKATSKAAALNDNTFVATIVEMALAESFNPFPKSNIKAINIPTTTKVISAMFNNY